MSLLALAVGVVCAAIAVAVIHAEAVGTGWRQALPPPLRRRGWGLALLPVALMAAVMTGHVHALAAVELALAGALVIWAPRLAVHHREGGQQARGGHLRPARPGPV